MILYRINARPVTPAMEPDIRLTKLINSARWRVPLAVVFGLLTACGSAERVDKSPPAAVQTVSYSVNEPAELPQSLTIKLRNQRGYLFAHTRIDGQRAGLFMFDTGSNLTVISTGVAGRLGLEVNGSSQATGVGGTQAFEYRSFESLEFGGVEMKGNRAAAISMHQMSRGIGTSISGLIGVRELGGLPFTLDYSNNTLTIYRRDTFKPPPGVQPRRASFNFAGLPLVSAELGEGREVWLILDSGADNELTLPRKCLALWPGIVSVRGSGSGHSAGVGGAVASTQTWLDTIEVFGLTLHDMPVSFEQAPEAFDRQPKPVGRIGGAFLKNFRLTMDPKRNLIWAQWLPGEAAE